MGMRGGTEADLLRACLTLLEVRGVFCWRQNAAAVPLPGGGFRRFSGLKGVSDILAVLAPHGTLLAVEVKGPRGRVSPEQQGFLGAVTALGGYACVIRDLRQLEVFLGELGL